MAKLNTYSLSGIKTSTNLPKVFQVKENLDILAQAVRVYQDRSHPGLSKVKTRGEMTLSTAKIWRQKGTGRARHGARSAPIFVGGGVAHGPEGIKRTLKMSRKMGKKSLLVTLSLKAKNGEVVVASNLSKINKTQEAQKLINTIIAKENLKKESTVSVIVGKESIQVRKAFRNLKNVKLLSLESLNTLDVFLGGLLIFEKEAFDTVAKTKVSKDNKPEKVIIRKDVKVAKVTKEKMAVKAKPKKGA